MQRSKLNHTFQVNHPALKKFVPSTLRNVLPRKRLFDLIARYENACALWVAGPPGSGKSTLISSYLTEHRVHAVWYRIDTGDSDLATFFYFLGMAVDQAADLNEPRLPLLTAEYLLGMDTFAIRFFEKVVRRFKQPVWLIFDDFQEAGSGPEFIRMMRHAIAQAGMGLKICIISRMEPPPEMSRALAAQVLRTISWPDLAFNSAEHDELIEKLAPEIKGTELSMKLHQRTCGWISGLILILQQSAWLPARPPEGLEGIFDYFTTEILNHLLPRWRLFLLQTSLLDHMTAENAAKLTGVNEAGEILRSFYASNFFIERSPAESYKYITIFRDFLKDHLAKSFSAESVRILYGRAAKILAESGSIDEAVKMHSASRDWNGLTETILACASDMIAQGRHQTLKGWLNLLPEDVCRLNPMLMLYQGLSRLPNSPIHARDYLTRAYSKFVQMNNIQLRLLSWASIVESYHLERAGTAGLTDWIQEGEKIESLLPGDRGISSEIELAQGMLTALILGAPAYPKMSQWLKNATSLLYKCPEPDQKVKLAYVIVLAHCLRAELNQAEIMLEHFKAQLISNEISAEGRLVLLLMECLFLSVTGGSIKVYSKVRKAIAFGNQCGIHIFDGLLYTFSTYAALMSEKSVLARRNLERIAAIVPSTATLDLSHFYCLSSWEAYIRGDLGRALALIDKGREFAEESGWPVAILLSQTMRARLLAECQDWMKSEALATAAIEEARRHALTMVEFQARLALAEIRLLQGALEELRECLQQAFALSRLCGVIAGNWILRSRLSELCQWALQFRVERQQVLLFIRRHSLLPHSVTQASPAWPYPVKIFVLGQRKILIRDKPIITSKKTPKKALELLGILVYTGPQGIRRDTAADLLWPETDGDRAQQNLKTTLHRLKKLICFDQVFVTHHGRIALAPQHCWVDAWHFEDLLDQAINAENVSLKKKMLAEAFSVYNGPIEKRGSSNSLSIRFFERLKSKCCLADRSLNTLDRINRD